MNSSIARYAPWIAVGLASLYVAAKALPPSPKSGEMNLYEFGKIPVQQGGRIKPIDTVARVSLTIISERQEFEDGKSSQKLPAIRWLLDSMTSGDNGQAGPASKWKVFRIDHDQILNLLGLERRQYYRYSMQEINANRLRFFKKLPDGGKHEIDRNEASQLRDAGKIDDVEIEDKLKREVKRVKSIPDDDRDVYDRRLLQLEGHINLYMELATRTGPAVIPPIRQGQDQWISLLTIDQIVDRRAEEVWSEMVSNGSIDPLKMKETEKRTLQAQLRREILQKLSPAAAKFNEILDNYEFENVEGFNKAVREYRDKYLADVPAATLATSNFEAYVNHFEPFYLCSMLYLFIALIGCGAWLGWQEPLRRSAFALSIVAVALHTFAIIARMYIQGRPPVTNLYSSAVFIGWGCVLLCLGLECIYRNGIGNVIGATLGAATMMIAHRLAESGDTLEMLQAVLDTNLWLATHVTCVTLGYTTTYVAGFLGILYVLRGVFTKSLDSASVKTLGQMMYGVVCFAMLLSFTGTVLGGIWGDQSWGRFWGWDPKENGAVLVVIMNALILHARWCGLVKQRGMALLTIVGNMVTTWSWFGTNQLGVGLHAYGFSKELAVGCRYFWLGSLALIGIGLLPQKYWRSFSEDTVRERAARAKNEAQARKDLDREAKNRAKALTPGR